MNPELIYDIGLHRGEDTHFYLEKGFKVVAFEANPTLVSECRMKFASQIKSGKLHIVEGVISPNEAKGKIPFYVNDRASIWGTVEPDWAERNAGKGFGSKVVMLDSIDFKKSIESSGVPYYMKIDVEGVDLYVLESLLKFNTRPKFISIESEKVSFQDLIKEFDVLNSLGYRKFKVVQQKNIPGRKIEATRIDGSKFIYRFRDCSSGPFGEEVKGPWLSRSEALDLYGKIFIQYSKFGDGTKYSKYPRALKGVLSTAYKLSTGHRGPLPGWYDTHASL